MKAQSGSFKGFIKLANFQQDLKMKRKKTKNEFTVKNQHLSEKEISMLIWPYW